MSYILDALKKSEQQRQRGATPTLPGQVTVVTRRPSMHVFLGVFAFVLLGAGIVIGWLRPGLGESERTEQAPPASEPAVAKPSIPIAQLDSPRPLPVPAEMSKKTTPQTRPPQAAAKARAPSPPVEAPPTAPAQEQTVMTVAELPPQVQQEMPQFAVQLHAYSPVPGERVVTINFRKLREGDFITPDLRLDQITPDGLILNYKGYRFQRGIR